MATYESRKVGPNEFSFVGYPMQVQAVDYTFEDLESDPVSTLRMIKTPVEAGIFVMGLMHLVTDAFVGGTVDNIAIGDSGGTNEFDGGTDVAPVDGDVTSMSHGKFYATADYISVGHNVRTAGEGTLFIFYIDKRTNWRTKNDL